MSWHDEGGVESCCCSEDIQSSVADVTFSICLIEIVTKARFEASGFHSRTDLLGHHKSGTQSNVHPDFIAFEEADVEEAM
jgi:hypothetical protein